MFDREPPRAIDLLDPETWEVPLSISHADCRDHTGRQGLISCRTDDDDEDDR